MFLTALNNALWLSLLHLDEDKVQNIAYIFFNPIKRPFYRLYTHARLGSNRTSPAERIILHIVSDDKAILHFVSDDEAIPSLRFG
jgi:hypothetical protein